QSTAKELPIAEFLFESLKQGCELRARRSSHRGRFRLVLARVSQPIAVAHRIERPIAKVFDCAHPRALERIRRAQRRVGEGVIEVFADDSRVGQGSTVVQNQRRDLRARTGGKQVFLAIERVTTLEGLVSDTLKVEHQPCLACVWTSRKSEESHQGAPGVAYAGPRLLIVGDKIHRRIPASTVSQFPMPRSVLNSWSSFAFPPSATSDGKRLVLTRSIRGFADGAVSILLPSYLTAVGFSSYRIGAIVFGTLVGSAALTLWIGLFANRLGRRRVLLAAC